MDLKNIKYKGMGHEKLVHRRHQSRQNMAELRKLQKV